jgi:hypothetical protein
MAGLETQVERTPEGKWVVKPVTTTYEFKTDTKVPKLGYVMRERAEHSAHGDVCARHCARDCLGWCR